MPKPIKKVESKTEGSQSNPHPWVEPFPASVLAEDGKTETVFVKARVGQDVILNSKMHKAGLHVLPCNFAHSISNLLSPPL